MEALLMSAPVKGLVEAKLRVTPTTAVFDMSAVAQFTLIQRLDIRIAGERSPLHMESLSALHDARCVVVHAPNIDQTLDTALFTALIKGWPHLKELDFSSTNFTPRRLLPKDATMERPHPALRLQDLGVLGHYQDIRIVTISVNTECNGPLLAPSSRVNENLMLDLADSHLSMEASTHAETFIRLLCPRLSGFSPGYPYEAWSSIDERYKRQLCEGMSELGEDTGDSDIDELSNIS